MTAWRGYQTIEQLQHRYGPRATTAVNAGLAESAAALTAVLAARPDAFDGYVTEREASGRPPWHAADDPRSPEFTAALVGEIHALIGHVLHALRGRVVTSLEARVAAYDAVDLAHWRTGQVQRLPAERPTAPARAGTFG